ncbi:UNVERIFIED_CONTAM: hypothetical protein HDU68_002486 [Siphonaria sp. JEL0065]|nr:hypothetical protein HDU68_002486 [Siphonaria sp. JEL0065]
MSFDCYGPYPGTIGDAGWEKGISCGQVQTPSSNTNWPPADCPNPALPVNTTSWIPLGPYSFPYDSLDHGYGSNKLTKSQVYAILSMVWAIENSETSIDAVIPWYHAYPYIQNIGDGRGYTTNVVGFCSGTGDLIEMLTHLQKYEPCNPMVQYIPDVAALSNAESGKLTGLLGFAPLVLQHGGGPKGESPINPSYMKATWDTLLGSSSSGYWKTAMDYSRQYHLSLPISKGQLYDIGLNAGTTGLANLLSQVKAPAPTAAESGGPVEVKWLLALQERWINRLKTDPSINDLQTDRGFMWQHLVDPKNNTLNTHNQVGANNVDVNLDFTLPISINCYGNTINIRAPPAETGSTTTTTTAASTTTTTTVVSTTNQPSSSTTTTTTLKPTTSTTTTTTAVATTARPNGCYPVWSSASSYSGGAQVSYNNNNYIAKWWADSNNIPGNGDPWNPQGPCGGSSTTVAASSSSTTTTTTVVPVSTTKASSTTTTTTTVVPVSTTEGMTTGGTTTTTVPPKSTTTTGSVLGQPCTVYGSSQCVAGTMYYCTGAGPYAWAVWYKGC